MKLLVRRRTASSAAAMAGVRTGYSASIPSGASSPNIYSNAPSLSRISASSPVRSAPQSASAASTNWLRPGCEGVVVAWVKQTVNTAYSVARKAS